MSITYLTHVYLTIPQIKNSVQLCHTYQHALSFAMRVSNLISAQRVDGYQVIHSCTNFWTSILGQSNIIYIKKLYLHITFPRSTCQSLEMFLSNDLIVFK